MVSNYSSYMFVKFICYMDETFFKVKYYWWRIKVLMCWSLYTENVLTNIEFAIA